MATTRDNHYVPQWHQKGFMDERGNQLCHLTRREINLPNGELKIANSKKWYTSAQSFYGVDLYSIFFGTEVSDDIERKLFGPIDEGGSKAVRAFLTNDHSQWHHNFEDFFTYLDTQKLRTPKGLDWIKSKYPELDQKQLMLEMQSLRTIHCTLWAESVRELVSAENSDVKFIVSDHPVTIYNYACSPDSAACSYPNDPDISLKGSQTIFPLDKNRCLILTNLEYAQAPENTNPLEQRINATRIRRSMVSTIDFINSRRLNADEVTRINYIIKSRAKTSVAAGKDEWLYPENKVACDWADLRYLLLPPPNELYRFGGEIYAGFEDGAVHYQDAFGRSTPSNEYLNKNIDEALVGYSDFCGCGSGYEYKHCCLNVSHDLRTTWGVASIRERNLAFCNCIRDVLGLDSGKTWLDVRKDLSEHHITKIYEFYSFLWPQETDIYSLLPKSDGKFRGLYSGILDVRAIAENALPMASIFDELLIETPVTNPNNIRAEFSPIKSPSKHKYQALKEFMFMLQIEPFIEFGLVNLIPDPSEFDMALKSAMLKMVKGRDQEKKAICKQDLRLHNLLATEDLLNVTALMPKIMRIQMLKSQFGLDATTATMVINELDRTSEDSPLMMLQSLNANHGGQFIHFRMGPNYEMALLMAQVTGSVLVTDSGSRWQQFMPAQHLNQGKASYPWNDAFNQLAVMPIDEQFLSTYQKSQGLFATTREHLKKVDQMVLDNNRNAAQLAQMSSQAVDLKERLGLSTEQLILTGMKVISPDGGFYDPNVQRLLAQSSCLRYDHRVRSVYGIGLYDHKPTVE